MKYCLKGLLGVNQRKSVFLFIDVCKRIFDEVQNTDELPSLLNTVNHALAQLEKDMPATIQVNN